MASKHLAGLNVRIDAAFLEGAMSLTPIVDELLKPFVCLATARLDGLSLGIVNGGSRITMLFAT